MNIIKADEGKVFRRIADGKIYGNQISLGLSYYINGIKLAEPHVDTIEDFEQIDAPVRKTRENFEEERRLRLEASRQKLKAKKPETIIEGGTN